MYSQFGCDESSLAFLTYQEAKQRREVLQPLFSRNAVIKMFRMRWLIVLEVIRADIAGPGEETLRPPAKRKVEYCVTFQYYIASAVFGKSRFVFGNIVVVFVWFKLREHC